MAHRTDPAVRGERGGERKRKEVQESRAEPRAKRASSQDGQGSVGKRSWGREAKVESWPGLGQGLGYASPMTLSQVLVSRNRGSLEAGIDLDS